LLPDDDFYNTDAEADVIIILSGFNLTLNHPVNARDLESVPGVDACEQPWS
jgi:hypothetical protein